MVNKVGSKCSKMDCYQNVGIMMDYAYNNINSPSKISVFLGIAMESLGRGNTKTPHKTQEFWAKYIGITRKTFNKIIRELEADGHIKIVHPEVFLEGGGSMPYAYSPIIPKEFEQYIKLNNNSKDKEVQW